MSNLRADFLAGKVIKTGRPLDYAWYEAHMDKLLTWHFTQQGVVALNDIEYMLESGIVKMTMQRNRKQYEEVPVGDAEAFIEKWHAAKAEAGGERFRELADQRKLARNSDAQNEAAHKATLEAVGDNKGMHAKTQQTLERIESKLGISHLAELAAEAVAVEPVEEAAEAADISQP